MNNTALATRLCKAVVEWHNGAVHKPKARQKHLGQLVGLKSLAVAGGDLGARGSQLVRCARHLLCNLLVQFGGHACSSDGTVDLWGEAGKQPAGACGRRQLPAPSDTPCGGRQSEAASRKRALTHL